MKISVDDSYPFKKSDRGPGVTEQSGVKFSGPIQKNGKTDHET